MKVPINTIMPTSTASQNVIRAFMPALYPMGGGGLLLGCAGATAVLSSAADDNRLHVRRR